MLLKNRQLWILFFLAYTASKKSFRGANSIRKNVPVFQVWGYAITPLTPLIIMVVILKTGDVRKRFFGRSVCSTTR